MRRRDRRDDPVRSSSACFAGLVAGYYRGRVDTVIAGLIDVTWGFPIILLAIMFAGIIRPGFTSIILAVALLSWAGIARIIRGYALSLREREFVAAARALGIPGWRIILTHLLPNVTAPILVLASYYIAVTIVIEAGLSFLGLGIQQPVPSLGQMLSEGRNFLRLSAWQTALPGAIAGHGRARVQPARGRPARPARPTSVQAAIVTTAPNAAGRVSGGYLVDAVARAAWPDDHRSRATAGPPRPWTMSPSPSHAGRSSAWSARAGAASP